MGSQVVRHYSDELDTSQEGLMGIWESFVCEGDGYKVTIIIITITTTTTKTKPGVRVPDPDTGRWADLLTIRTE